MFLLSASFNGSSPIPPEHLHSLQLNHNHYHNLYPMTDLKPLQILLLTAPLLLNSIFAHTDTPTPNLSQQTTMGGRLSSSNPHLPPPRNNQTAEQNKLKALRDELASKLSIKRFRSHRLSRRKRRRQRALQRASGRSSQDYIPTVSLTNICFAILASILHNLVSVNSH